MNDIELTNQQLQKIYQILKKGDRVELFLNKDGIKLLKVKRENVK